MKRILGFLTVALMAIAVFALVAVPLKGDNDPQTPYIQTVNPESAQAGAVITADGTCLGKALVKEIYLTRGNTDIKLEITSQKNEQITAKLPATIESGRYRLMVLTSGLTPRFIEQPVQLNVE